VLSKGGALDYDTESLIYGAAHLYGEMYTDRVCIDPDNTATCVENFGLFLIKAQSGLSGLDGIVGLSPPSGNNGPSFI